ncbi:formate dehydrogenase accessory protein FdhD [marine bacterium AO1-C]|nr:formate dehydrogenase accessory protein FdhD [marine bacterium AO1-C]
MMQPKPSVFPSNITKFQAGTFTSNPDLLAVEEPLEIQLNFIDNEEIVQKTVAITMRTPGNDFELALGFLFGEGIINSMQEVIRIRYCESIKKPEERGNVVKVTLRPHVKVDLQRLERHFYTNSSCGVCGKTSIEALEISGCPVLPTNRLKVTSQLLTTLPDKLREAQSIFQHTGGIHAAALFDTQGQLVTVREDVGRHNAMDKLIGSHIKSPEIMQKLMVLVSGRLSFELVQKAINAQIPLIAAVGAPSSLAVQLASAYQMTLVGFLRGGQFNVYTVPERVV